MCLTNLCHHTQKIVSKYLFIKIHFVCVCVCLSVLACLYVHNVHTVPMESRRGYISPGTGVNSQF